MTYQERLRVPFWWWLGAALLVASVAVAVLAYVPWGLALAVSVLFALGVGIVVHVYGSAAVEVTDQGLRVGRNRIEGEWIGGATALTPEETAHAMGPGADVRAFLQTRPYLKRAVRIDVADAADPHPHWLVSSRRPAELAAAVQAIARGAA